MTTLAQEAQNVGEQCVVFVEHVTGVGYGLGTAADYLTSFKSSLTNTPQVGDIAIWGANSNGADSAGHVAIVTALTPTGTPIVTGANWAAGTPFGAGAYTNQVGTNGMGAPTAFLNPADVGGTTAATGPEGAATDTAASAASGTFAPAATGSGWSIGPWQLLSGSALRRTGFTLVGIALIGVGLMLLLRRDIGAAVATASKAAAA